MGLLYSQREAGVRLQHVSTRPPASLRSEEHTSELQSHSDLVCRLLLEKKNMKTQLLCLVGWIRRVHHAHAGCKDSISPSAVPIRASRSLGDTWPRRDAVHETGHLGTV